MFLFLVLILDVPNLKENSYNLKMIYFHKDS